MRHLGLLFRLENMSKIFVSFPAGEPLIQRYDRIQHDFIGGEQ
jgi:hypothetical protein